MTKPRRRAPAGSVRKEQAQVRAAQGYEEMTPWRPDSVTPPGAHRDRDHSPPTTLVSPRRNLNLVSMRKPTLSAYPTSRKSCKIGDWSDSRITRRGGVQVLRLAILAAATHSFKL
jgi:hypothetical protein